MLISCVLQCTDGLRLIKRLENYAYRMSEKTAYRSLEKSAYRSLKKLLTVHLQIHLTACIQNRHGFPLFDPNDSQNHAMPELIHQNECLFDKVLKVIALFFSL